MRLALISDIHANFPALMALSDVLESADRVLCLGDLIGYYCQVNEVISYMRDLPGIFVLGNHDRFLLEGCPPELPAAARFGIEFAARVISEKHRKWLAGLPLVWGGVLDGRSLLLSHGSPWKPMTDYLYPSNPALNRLRQFNFDVIAFGQTHRVLMNCEKRPYLLNPGSVGQSRDVQANACALVLDTTMMQVESIARPFDADPVVALARRKGAGQWISKHLQ
jgi:predicted phosphodiesterase